MAWTVAPACVRNVALTATRAQTRYPLHSCYGATRRRRSWSVAGRRSGGVKPGGNCGTDLPPSNSKTYRPLWVTGSRRVLSGQAVDDESNVMAGPDGAPRHRVPGSWLAD